MNIPELVLKNDDERVIRARAAEEKFFNHYNLKPAYHAILLKPYNISIRVAELGAGEPVVIIPGNTGDGFPFIPLVAGLKNRRIILVNRPGGGLSDGMDYRTVNFREFARNTIETILDFFELADVPIIAHSIGGHWGLWFALDRPDRLRALVLLGVPGNVLDTCPPFPLRLASVPVLNRMFFRFISPTTKAMALKSLLFMGHLEEKLQKLPENLGECYFYFQKLPYYELASLSLMEKVNRILGSNPEIRISADELKNIQKRVLLIWGTNDPFGRIETGQKIAQLIPRGKFHKWEGGGHLPWLDGPEECAALITSFIESLV
jgi:pimeloyl-ACP methyl ester carboxylesterase